MTEQKQITLEEALELVEFQQDVCGGWRVGTVKGNCHVVKGHCTIVEGDCVCVRGKVRCTINGREWKFIETPEQKFRRLLDATGDKELIDAFNRFEKNCISYPEDN